MLNDLVSESQPQETNLFATKFEKMSSNKSSTFSNNNNTSGVFTSDPFGEDPFDKSDPFEDFSKQDPFENEFRAEFKDTKNKHFSDKITSSNNNETYLSRSPKSIVLEKQISLTSTSPRNAQFTKQNTFSVQFEKFENKKLKLSQLNENHSLDLSSESECAPEPPPRPTANVTQIKPPPLPPKKQHEISFKPPPRPPHSEDSHYDYMDNYETGPNSLDYLKNVEKSPPLPVPARKSKFDSEFSTAPERPRKQNSVKYEEEYLTPISFPSYKKDNIARHTGPLLLPPPQKIGKKQSSCQNNSQKTVASILETKPSSVTSDKLNLSLEDLDITLSQLTLSGLNELATKLNIPASQLSNMTLVQLTNYLSNFIKNNSNVNTEPGIEVNCNNEFKADFAANFNNLSNTSTNSERAYDRYAVFRELLKDEINQTKTDIELQGEPEEKDLQDNIETKMNNFDVEQVNDTKEVVDKYAALREIVEQDIKEKEKIENNCGVNEDDILVKEQNNKNEQNNVNAQIETNEKSNLNGTESEIIEKNLIIDDKNSDILPPKDIMSYDSVLQSKKDTNIITSAKSPTNKIPKSPVQDGIQNNVHLNSGSLSDVISGSSPEVDNNGTSTEIKKSKDAAGKFKSNLYSLIIIYMFFVVF